VTKERKKNISNNADTKGAMHKYEARFDDVVL
jgi:hypothetical protein